MQIRFYRQFCLRLTSPLLVQLPGDVSGFQIDLPTRTNREWVALRWLVRTAA